MLPDAAPGVANLAGPALHEAKRVLRERMLAAREALPPSARADASAAIVRRLLLLPSFATAQTVVLTLPFGSEWDTRPLVAAALHRDKKVVLPRVDSTTRMLVLHAIDDLARDTAPGYRGIPEPRPACPVIAAAAVEWILVPGLAFDATGQRLGYGGGYYDRLLPQLPVSAARIGGAFELQLIDWIPAAPHDLAVDTLITPTQTLSIPPRPK